MSHPYDAAADAAATAWAAALPSDLIDRIVLLTISTMEDDDLTILPYQDMHDVCDPNQYLADATDAIAIDTDDLARVDDDGYALIALANRCTDRFDAFVDDEVETWEHLHDE